MKKENSALSHLTLAALAIVFGAIGTTTFGAGQMPTSDQIKERVTVHRPYKIGDEVEMTVPIGQAVQFDCAENPYWVKEYLVYPAADSGMCICYFDAEGDVMRITSVAFERKGSVRQVDDTPCLAILKWTVKDQAVALQFCLSADKERNQRAFDQVLRETGQWNMQNKSRSPYPPRTLPETKRLAGFIRLWSEVKYNFANFDLVPELDWNKVLEEYLPQVQQAATTEDSMRVLARCVALLHDGHTHVNYSLFIDRGAFGLPLKVRPLAGKQAVIVRMVPAADIRSPKRKEELVKANLKPGEEITHLDGRPVGEILKQDIYPYTCASTPQSRDLTAYRDLLMGPSHSKARLRVQGLDGTQREVTLTRADYGFALEDPTGGYECRELGDGIVYVNLPDFASEKVVSEFQRTFPQVQKAKGLILDVRHNGGGNSQYGDAITSLLTDKPIKGLRWKTRKYMPAFRAWGRKEQWHEEEGDAIKPSGKDPFLGPVVVLTGPETFSAAEDFVVPLHAGKRATVVGERTGGSTGQPLQIDLPGDIHARICTKRDTYPDGREFVGVGVIPDVEVHPTAADLAAGRDRVLEEGLATLRKMMSP